MTLIADRDRGNASYRLAERSTHSSSRSERSNGMSRAEAPVFECQRDATASSIDRSSLWIVSCCARRRQYPHRHGSCCGMRIVQRFQFTHAVWNCAISPPRSPSRPAMRQVSPASKSCGAGRPAHASNRSSNWRSVRTSSWVCRVVSTRRRRSAHSVAGRL